MKGLLKETTELKPFTVECLLNQGMGDFPDSVDIVTGYWHNAKDIEEFKKLVLDDERLMYNQGFAELLKETNYCECVKRVNNMIVHATEVYTTYCDAGGLKIGNGAFSMVIPNGLGGGSMKVGIFRENAKFNESLMDYVGSCEGEIEIFSYDAGNVVECVMAGSYLIYSGYGFIAFVEFEP